VSVYLPKFKFEFDTDLRPTLHKVRRGNIMIFQGEKI